MLTEYNLNVKLHHLQEMNRFNDKLNLLIGEHYLRQFDVLICRELTKNYYDMQKKLAKEIQELYSCISQGFYINIIKEKETQVVIKNFIGTEAIVTEISNQGKIDPIKTRTISFTQIVSIHKNPYSDN